MKLFGKIESNRNLRYYLGEIIIVTIGIFIAIQLNNLNDSVRERKEEEQALSRIYNDLKIEKYMFAQEGDLFSKSYDYLCGILYDEEYDNLDSIWFYLALNFEHYKMNSEYINLKSSGKLSLIKNDKLRYRIVRYYEGIYEQYAKHYESHKDFIKQELKPYCDEVFITDTSSLIDPAQVLAQLKEPKFRSIMMSQIRFYKYFDQIVKPIDIGCITEILEDELDVSKAK